MELKLDSIYVEAVGSDNFGRGILVFGRLRKLCNPSARTVFQPAAAVIIQMRFSISTPSNIASDTSQMSRFSCRHAASRQSLLISGCIYASNFKTFVANTFSSQMLPWCYSLNSTQAVSRVLVSCMACELMYSHSITWYSKLINQKRFIFDDFQCVIHVILANFMVVPSTPRWLLFTFRSLRK